MQQPLRVLISAAFSHSSRGIVRSIKLSKKYKNSYIIGTDICKTYFGLYEGLFDKIYKIPRYSDSSYKSAFLDIIEKEKADIVIITHELEVQFWSKFKEKQFNSLIPPSNFTEICISKKKLYNSLKDTKFIPKYSVINLGDAVNELNFEYPIWIRDVSEGVSGGKGAFLLKSKKHFKAWIDLFEPNYEVMVSEYLPGRNLACLLLIENNKLIKAGTYERLDYLLKHASPTGITGQISQGRLIQESNITNFAFGVVKKLISISEDQVSGFMTVDIKEDHYGNPKVTEINLRPVSPVFAFAQADFNLVEFYIDSILGVQENTLDIEKKYPDNILLREIDGLPIWVKNHKDLKIGDSL